MESSVMCFSARKLQCVCTQPQARVKVPSNVLQSAVTLITPQKSPDISDIPVDSGAIVNTDVSKGYKEAVYKDPKGKVETFSGLCPHLGCQLQASAKHVPLCFGIAHSGLHSEATSHLVNRRLASAPRSTAALS